MPFVRFNMQRQLQKRKQLKLFVAVRHSSNEKLIVLNTERDFNETKKEQGTDVINTAQKYKERIYEKLHGFKKELILA